MVKHERITTILCLGLPLLTFIIGLTQLHIGKTPHYFVTNYMVSYSAGFVRRGLLGTCFLYLSDQSHLSPDVWITSFRILIGATYLGTLSWLVYSQRSKLQWIGCLVLLANPFVCCMGWWTFGAIESLFPVAVVAHCLIARNLEPDKYRQVWIPLIVIFGVFFGLVHEGFLLLGLPIHITISGNKLGWSNWWRWILMYLPAIVACLAGVAFSGTANQASAIRAAWHSHGIEIPFVSVLTYFGVPLSVPWRYLVSLQTPSQWSLMLGTWTIGLLPIIWLSRSLHVATKDEKVVRYLTYSCALPLFFVANDWARWIAIPTITLIFFVLTRTDWNLRPAKQNQGLGAILGLVLVGSFISPASPHDTVRTAFYGIVQAGASAVHRYILGHHSS